MRSLFYRSARLVGASAVVLATLPMLSASADAAGSGTPQTSSVLTLAENAIGKQTSVHLVVTSKSSPTLVREHLEADLEKSSGIETITEGSGRAMIKVTPSYAYLSGNSSGLTDIFGMTSADVHKVGANWVSVKAGTTQYKDLAASMTISTITSVLPAAKGTKLYRPVPPASNLYTLKWETAATSSQPAWVTTLTLSAMGATLPVQETSTASGGQSERVAFSKWGEHVLVSAPPVGSTIALSKLPN
jgi:hypothetical protein